MWIVFLGPPGCGKGTQSEYLIKEKGFKVISTGDLLRANLSRLVDGKRTIGDIIGAGALLPDSVTIGIIKDEIAKSCSSDVIFDGFPRTIAQAEALNDMARECGNKIDKVVYFKIEDQVIIKRITGRYKCAKCGKIYNKFFLQTKIDGICDMCGGTEFECRADDNEVSLAKRLKEYHEKTYPLIDFYSKSGILYNVDADASMQDVISALLGVLYG